MKQLIIITGLIATGITAEAQSVQDGNNQLYYERYASAEKTFTQLTTADPTNAEAWFGLAKTYMLTDCDALAAAALAKAPAAMQSQPLFEAAKGWVALSQGAKESANAAFADALRQTKEKDPAVLAAIATAEINVKEGDAQYAVDLLNKAIKRDKHNAALWTLMGDAYRKMTNGTEAYQSYKKAIEENDKYAAAYHSIGQIFQTQKNPEMYLDYFNKAIAADPSYAPSLYSLYSYNYYHDAAKAIDYYRQYMAKSDPSVQNEYDLTDLLYLNKNYDAAIAKAKEIYQREGESLQPRLYKLIAYSYAGIKDTAQALSFMQQYFQKAPDSMFIAPDFATASQLYSSLGNDSLARVYLVRATEKETDSVKLLADYKLLADLAKGDKDYDQQAKWLGLYYNSNKNANNQDLYFWALAHYLAKDFAKADSVFGMYAAKYPEQSFGYYWQARSQSMLDSGMREGLAIPTYQKLIEVLNKDTSDANYKKWMVEAYGYLAAYEANKEKDYKEAIDYFGKLLEVDPENESAKKYIAILEKQVEK